MVCTRFPIAQSYASYLLGSCSLEKGTRPQLTLTRAFPDQGVFSLAAVHSSTKLALPAASAAKATASQLNICSYGYNLVPTSECNNSWTILDRSSRSERAKPGIKNQESL